MRRVAIAFTLWGLMTGVIASTVSANDEAEAYISKIEKRIMATWKMPPKSDGLKVTLRYKLARNGSVSFARVEETSGNQSFDDSAVQAVRHASPFPPPPKSFPIGDIRMVLDPKLPAPSKSVPKKRPEHEI
jgi:TolA protein